MGAAGMLSSLGVTLDDLPSSCACKPFAIENSIQLQAISLMIRSISG
jgi:hypothetical protein